MNVKRISAVVMSLAMIGTSLPFSDIAISFADKNIITANAEEGYATNAYPETNETSSYYYEDVTTAETEPWTDAYESTEIYEATNAYYDEYETTRDYSDDVVATTEKYLSSGKCGDDVYYTLTNDGVLTISGSGSIGYSQFSSPFQDNKSIKSVVIEDGITSIEYNAFYNCTNLENIVISDSVISIGESAFEYCESLTSIAIPNSVTSIGKYAFEYCENLTSIAIPDSVISIGERAFGYCKSLTSIAIPDSVTSVGEDAFEYCENLTSIVIPNSVTSIGKYATYECENLKDVYYSGTESDWNKISIGEYNSGILNANIHFLGEDPPTSETTGTEVEFEIGNISAKAGDGYGEEGSDTEWSVILPIMVNNDTGLAGINGTLNVSSDLAKVFQLEKISLEDEDTDAKGPYTGTFIYETKYWVYSIASSGYRNWEKQPDGTPFIYYYVKVTKDKSLIARVADGMGIELDSDENGSYYKFPIEWYTSDSEANIVSDINLLETKPSLKNGSVKVYVNSEEVTTEPATTTTEPVATTGYKSTTKITTTQAPLSVSPKSTTIEVGESFTIDVKADDNPTVSYSLNRINIVEVDANGKVTGINSGETKILVYTDDGRSDIVRVTVVSTKTTEPATTTTESVATTTTPIILTDATETTRQTYAPLKASPDEITIVEGERATITVTGGDGDYKFVVSDEDYAITNSYGTVLGLKSGVAVVTVIDGVGHTDTVYVYVTAKTYATTTEATTATTTKITYAELVVSPKEITIDVNEAAKINVTGGDNNYTFKSNDDSIAEAGNNGMIIAYKPGETVVKVTDGLGNLAVVKVIVLQPVTTTTVTTVATTTTALATTYAPLVVSPKSTTIDVATEFEIDVTGGDENYTFKSSNEESVKVDTTGKVIAYAPGYAIVTVTDGRGESTIVKVTVRQPETTAPATTMTTTRVTTTIITTTPIILTDATETTRQTYAPLEASPDEITINEGERATINVTGGDGDYKFVVSDEDYAIVSSYGTVLGLKSGVAVVTVIDGEGNTDTVYVYITAKTYTTTTETTYRTTVRTTTRTTYRTWSTDPWEETTYPQASEEASRATEISWEATTAPWVTEPSTILGDVNADYKVDSKDAVLILNYYAAELVNIDTTSDYMNFSAADVNDDGKINSKDAILILRYYAYSLAGIVTGSMSDFVSSDVPDAMETRKIATITIGTVTVKPGTKTVYVPVTIFDNSRFAGGGFVFNYDSDLTFNKVEGNIIGSPVKFDYDNSVSVTFASSKNITENGVMFTLQFELPDVIKAGDVYSITGSLDTFCDEYRFDLPIKIVDGAIKVEDGEYETTEPATTARPVYSTTRKTTAISYNSGISTATKNITFSIGNVSAKSGDGYGEDGTNEKWPVSLPIKVNNDCGIAGINASIDVDDDLKKIFQLESISLSGDVYSGPYSGTFITSIDKWRFALSNTANGNWLVQPDGTPFVWYNMKVTEDKSLIEKVAANKGIKLNNDSTGSYYEFTLSLNEDGKVVDTSGMKVEPYFESGSIKVYVNIYSETTSSTGPWEETTEAFYVTPKNMTLKPGEKSSIFASGFEPWEFTSADESIVTVDEVGSVTAVSPGTTYITVKNNKGQTDTVSVTVTAPATTAASTTIATKKTAVTDPPVNKDPLKADVNNIELEVGKKFKIKANQNDLTYTTSNSNIAIVSKSGEITAISAGTVVITVINPDKEAVSITVTVKNPVTTPTKPNIILGDVNIDGEVDSKDAVLVLKDYAQVLTGSESSIDKARGDINGDNSIDSKDAVKILKYYANKMVRNDADIDIRNV